MSVKLSKTTKLDGVRSWSLQAVDTCPGSMGTDGALVDACKGCYATTGFYRMGSVIAPREFNRVDWKRSEWVTDMIDALKKESYFRWFDSGDIYSLALAEKMLELMKATPWVKHWLPTRSYKFDKYKAVLQSMKDLPNVAVRFSSDSISGEFTHGLHGSVIVQSIESLPAGVTLCHAAINAGKCGPCRSCYDPAIKVIGYLAHGRKMSKVISIKSIV